MWSFGTGVSLRWARGGHSGTRPPGAGEHARAQLQFAAANGVEVRAGRREENRLGSVIAIPPDISGLDVDELDLGAVRDSYLAHALTDLDVGSLEMRTFAFSPTRHAWRRRMSEYGLSNPDLQVPGALVSLGSGSA
jgi:hypothetical protein